VTRQTFTVVSAYVGRDGKPRVLVKGRTLPLIADEPFEEGAAVVIEEGAAVVIRRDRAVKP
jgi:hypothetical protein